MAAIDDLLEMMDKAQQEKDYRNSLLGKVQSRAEDFYDYALSLDKPISDYFFGEGFIADSLKKASKAGQKGLPEKIGASTALALQGAASAVSKPFSSGGKVLDRVVSGFSSIYDDSTLDENLTRPDTASAIKTSADFTNQIKESLKAEATQNVKDNLDVLKKLGINEYVTQEASKDSPFFRLTGNEPTEGEGSKTKGFTRVNESIGQKSKQSDYESILGAIETGDFSSASKALSGLPKEDKTNFLALINEGQKYQARGQKESLPLELVGKLKFLEFYNGLSPQQKTDPELLGKAKEAFEYLSSLRG